MRILGAPTQPASVPSAGWVGAPKIRILDDPAYTTSESTPRNRKRTSRPPAPSPPPNPIAPETLTNWKNTSTWYAPDMSRRWRRRFQAADASFRVPQEHRAIPRTLVRPRFKSFKVDDGVKEEPLPFGQSYWDYLPVLAQKKIVKMVHKTFLEEVHNELLISCRCMNCAELFMNPFESARHFSDGL